MPLGHQCASGGQRHSAHGASRPASKVLLATPAAPRPSGVNKEQAPKGGADEGGGGGGSQKEKEPQEETTVQGEEEQHVGGRAACTSDQEEMDEGGERGQGADRCRVQEEVQAEEGKAAHQRQEPQAQGAAQAEEVERLRLVCARRGCSMCGVRAGIREGQGELREGVMGGAPGRQAAT